MEDLVIEFIAETREMLDALGGEIVAWEADPGDRARLDAIFRFVHTVKGNCGFFDLPRLQALSHAAEDVLADVRAGRRNPDRRLVSAVLAIIDRIGELVQALETNEPAPVGNDDHLIAALHAVDDVAPEPEASASASEARRPIRSIRLSIELLDRMMSGVSDLVLARNELARRLREAPVDAAIEGAFERVSGCIAEMRDAIARTRMQRIDNLFAPLPRLVRDVAGELRKQVVLDVEGGDVELDREMIEMIRDPLNHIIRNAIDHGIEAPDERRRAGKPDHGSLRVRASQAGNQILIEVADDGRGLDGEKLVRKAIDNGLLDAEQAAKLSAAQRTALIFEPGLSTAKEVTAISGRGVGMDVVRANVERIGGVVDLDSRPGQGLRLTLRVPLTLTIIPALTVTAGGRRYAIPRSAIEEIVRRSSSMVRVEAVGGSTVVSIRERRIPLTSLAEVLGVPASCEAGDQRLIVLRPAGGDLYALAVDQVHDHEELVVKPAAPVVMAAGLYAGTTIADDGSPILLIDASGVASAVGMRLDQNKVEPIRPSTGKEAVAGAGTPALLLRGLDHVRRAIRLAVVERIEDVPAAAIQVSAGKLRVAIGGRILPLAGCTVPPAEGKVRVLRLADGINELAYAFGEVIDMVELGPEIQPALVPGEIIGVTLIGGEQVEVIDPYWLFGTAGVSETSPLQRPVCAIPLGDPWMNNILRPIVESSGYEVVGLEESRAAGADVVVASAEGEPPAGSSGEVLRIRSRPEPEHDNDDSIYRYDRAALLYALSRPGGRRS